ncbi:MAG: zinc ABC transporter substrate-binding protein [Halomonas subglaciescola]|nr:zinc ABC transporter substrate-binding protein [Halomonas subglaciescola]
MRLSAVLRWATGAALVLALPTAMAAERVQVVTSFSILADMVDNVGGEHVEATSLIGPDSDAHSYSPSPGDVRTLSHATLVVFNGLRFEGWMDRLLGTSGYQGTLVTATDGITPLMHDGHDHADDHAQGTADPHAWQDMARARTYVTNIRDGLIEADAEHEADYRANADRYLGQLDDADAEIRQQLGGVPADTAVITGHESFGYFADAYELRFLAPEGLSTATDPSAARIARLVDTIRGQHVQALFHENMTSPSAIIQLAEETGLPIAGTLYADALASEGEASSYIGMMRHNAKVLHQALADGQATAVTPD